MDGSGAADNNIGIEEVNRGNYNTIWIYVRCLARVSNDCANDITQDVFLVLVKKWDQLDKSNIRAWLYSVARAKIKEFFKAEKKQRGGNDTISLDEEAPDSDLFAGYDNYFCDDESLRAIKESILSVLQPQQRELYEEYFVKRKSYKDIMEQFSLSDVSARGRIDRIRKRLTKEIFKCLAFLAIGASAGYWGPALRGLIFNGR